MSTYLQFKNRDSKKTPHMSTYLQFKNRDSEKTTHVHISTVLKQG